MMNYINSKHGYHRTEIGRVHLLEAVKAKTLGLVSGAMALFFSILTLLPLVPLLTIAHGPLTSEDAVAVIEILACGTITFILSDQTSYYAEQSRSLPYVPPV